MDSTEVFNRAVDEIGRAYEDLGHELGWRFLYTPVNTLSKNTKLFLARLNLGGSRYNAEAR